MQILFLEACFRWFVVHCSSKEGEGLRDYWLFLESVRCVSPVMGIEKLGFTLVFSYFVEPLWGISFSKKSAHKPSIFKHHKIHFFSFAIEMLSRAFLKDMGWLARSQLAANGFLNSMYKNSLDEQLGLWMCEMYCEINPKHSFSSASLAKGIALLLQNTLQMFESSCRLLYGWWTRVIFKVIEKGSFKNQMERIQHRLRKCFARQVKE